MYQEWYSAAASIAERPAGQIADAPKGSSRHVPAPQLCEWCNLQACSTCACGGCETKVYALKTCGMPATFEDLGRLHACKI